MRKCSRISLFKCFVIAEHVSSDTPLIIRSSKTVVAASGFTYVCGCRQLSWLNGNSVLSFHSAMTAAGNHKHMENQTLPLQFLSSWWWEVCRSKHVEQLRNIGIINSTTRSHLFGHFYTIYRKFSCWFTWTPPVYESKLKTHQIVSKFPFVKKHRYLTRRMYSCYWLYRQRLIIVRLS